MTKVINLFGGSGLGKSTTAAGLYYEMKLRGFHVELVREYVKSWAWKGQKIGPFDQPYLFGKQSQAESLLYGKVDWVITDSPVLLSPIYEKFYSGNSAIEYAALGFLEKARNSGVTHYNVVLQRLKPFDTRGRYETEEQAKQVDKAVLEFLTNNKLPIIEIVSPDRDRVAAILAAVGVKS